MPLTFQNQCCLITHIYRSHILTNIFIFLLTATLIGRRYYIFMGLIYISLMLVMLSIFFTYFLVICMSLEKYLFRSFAQFLLGLSFGFGCFIFAIDLDIFWVSTVYHLCDLQTFSPFCRLSFHFDGFLHCAEVFQSHLFIFAFPTFALGLKSKKHYQIQKTLLNIMLRNLLFLFYVL